VQSALRQDSSPAATIEEAPPRPDPQPEPPPQPVPDPLPEPTREPEPSGLSAVPLRIEAPDAATAAILVQRAIGAFNPRLIEDTDRWIVLLRPDRPQEELMLAAIELVQAWLDEAGLDAALLEAAGRKYHIRTQSRGSKTRSTVIHDRQRAEAPRCSPASATICRRS
jgi:hypothetical protein